MNTTYQIPDKYDKNEEQKKVICFDQGYHLVLAPPGCGKTDILAERIIRAYSMGVKFEDMLCLTFTNRAARGMGTRFNEISGERGCGLNDVDTSELFVGNVHRFCSQFLYDNKHVSATAQILDEYETYNFIQEIMGHEENDDLDFETRTYYDYIVKFQHLVSQLRQGHPKEILMGKDCLRFQMKRRGRNGHPVCDEQGQVIIDVIDIAQLCKYFEVSSYVELYDNIEKFPQIIIDKPPFSFADLVETYKMVSVAKKYEQAKKDSNALDFDDLLIKTYDIVNNPNGEFHKYSWVQVDEVQDLSPMQHAIIDKITLPSPESVVVYLGDEQQAIFSFIGAKLETLDMLKEKCLGHVTHLYKNYRSPQYLLDIYNEFATKELKIDPSLLPTTDKQVEPKDEDRVIFSTGSIEDEYKRAVDLAIKYSQMERYDDKDKGRVAILVDTNKHADEIGTELHKRGIRHFKISGKDCFSSPDIKMLFAHLSVLSFEYNRIAWARIMHQLKIRSKFSQCRILVNELVEQMILPSDLLRSDNSTYMLDFMSIYDKEYVIFDTETTGLDVFNDDIIQIAAIKVRQGIIVEEFNEILYTDKTIPPHLGKIVNPLVEDYKKAEQEGRVMNRREGILNFMRFIGNSPILGHNVEYDYHILDYNLRRDCAIYNLNERCPKYFDSLKIAHIVEPNLKAYKLKILLEIFGLQGENSHKADDDIIATKSVVDYCANKFNEILYEKGINQQKYLEEHIEDFSRFKALYAPIYEHTRKVRYELENIGDKPKMVAELEYIYEYLKRLNLVGENEKIKHVFKFLAEDVLKDEKEKSLHEQLAKHVMELSTFKEADLCDSDIMTEKFFVSTVHKAKGLEFTNVIVLNAVDGVYPHFTSKTEERRKEDARKFYVAISRARWRLCIMTYKKKRVRTWEFDVSPTPFLNYIYPFFNN